MNGKVYLASAVFLSMATAAALAQYTPGSGVPYVPAPTVPAAPAPVMPINPAQPGYSWQAPAPRATPLQQVAPQAVQVIQAPPEVVIPQLSDAQLNDLTSSVALYPDPLIGELLPAATYVQEVTYADKWLAQHPGADEASIASLPVHPSVQTLMHYPTVLSMLANNIDWTQALGVAFQYQPNDVMEAIQRWRLTAVTYGTLYSTPQLSVARQGNIILIAPPPTAQTIYVPVYDPAVVFVRPVRPIRDAITFSAGGISLSFIHNDVDWGHHEIHVPVRRHVDVVEHVPGRDVVAHDVVVAGDHHDGPPERHAFVHDDAKPVIMYPNKIVTPTDHRVVNVPPAHGRGDQGHGDAGRGRGDDHGDAGHTDNNRGDAHPDTTPPQGRGRNNNPPGTPF